MKYESVYLKSIYLKNLVYLLFGAFFLFSCTKFDDLFEILPENNQEVFNARNHLASLGFDLRRGIIEFRDGYVIENDIFIKKDDVPLLRKDEDGFLHINRVLPQNSIKKLSSLPSLVDYNGHYYKSTVTIPTYGYKRSVKIYLSPTVSQSLSYQTVQVALERFNELNLSLFFSIVYNLHEADIVVNGVSSAPFLMAAGFPYFQVPSFVYSPYNEIIVNTSYNFDEREDGASIFAHEIGHCIGFRHTDYMDLTYSCGGLPNSEGPDIHISGTPTGPSAESWMLACTNGADRPFTTEDIQALRALYAAELIYVKKVRTLLYDYSSYMYCCDYVDMAHSITLEFYLDAAHTIPYFTHIGNFLVKASLHTPSGSNNITYTVPNGVSSYTLPHLDIEKYTMELGDLKSDDSEYVHIFSVPHHYTVYP